MQIPTELVVRLKKSGLWDGSIMQYKYNCNYLTRDDIVTRVNEYENLAKVDHLTKGEAELLAIYRDILAATTEN